MTRLGVTMNVLLNVAARTSYLPRLTRLGVTANSFIYSLYSFLFYHTVYKKAEFLPLYLHSFFSHYNSFLSKTLKCMFTSHSHFIFQYEK